jgi:hypothetical protein
MAQKLTLEYDRIGDILYIQTCPPYAGQESDELGDEMVGRFHPGTGALECVEILSFTRRFRRRRTLGLPFAIEARPQPARARRAAARAPARTRRR